ncbi:DUF4350 domain-containing protein [Foetidibacter luteolus]|uniref:DUF4350 domain-containing protein n=1 Tax=Foetidibacter luteolus TaxID=2608880 RepID=UPI00129A5CE3|nr:DUF4350 domain-containing protein [Foetidibacter luteolus]
MKKNIIYIILGAVVLLVVILVIAGNKSKTFDERITLNRKYKNPYGLYAVYNLLDSMFRGAETSIGRTSPAQWGDYDYISEGKTLMFIVSQQFNPSHDELKFLNEFVKEGNTIFISTSDMSSKAKDFLGLEIESGSSNGQTGNSYFIEPSNKVSLVTPQFPASVSSYVNPGISFSTFFRSYDTSYYELLGKNSDNRINFLRLRSGKGSFLIHSDPLLLANYFLLYKENIRYLESILSLVPEGSTKKVIWDEYYRYKLAEDEDGEEPSVFRVLMKHEPFRWALLLAMAMIGIFILLNAKRAQRFVPVLEKPKNDSMDFIKTIGRLYFEKGDHANLARKMVVYFLDFVRTKYLIPTGQLDDDFIKTLSGKSGYDEEKTRRLIEKVQLVQADGYVDEQRLIELHQEFTEFYATAA